MGTVLKNGFLILELNVTFVGREHLEMLVLLMEADTGKEKE